MTTYTLTRPWQNSTASARLEMSLECCCACGVIYGVPTEFQDARRKDHKTFYCPSGHGQHYGENATEQALKKAEERLASEKAWSRRVEADLASERRSHSATKGQLTKVRKRIQNGVCPDCNRHFTNLERHMATKHGATS